MDDALELLGTAFTDGRVRAFAVKQLGRADDEVSAMYASCIELTSDVKIYRSYFSTSYSSYKRSNSNRNHPSQRHRLADLINPTEAHQVAPSRHRRSRIAGWLTSLSAGVSGTLYLGPLSTGT